LAHGDSIAPATEPQVMEMEALMTAEDNIAMAEALIDAFYR
jgi:hypothetical protein